jgi:hypothetical protein
MMVSSSRCSCLWCSNSTVTFVYFDGRVRETKYKKHSLDLRLFCSIVSYIVSEQ